MPRVFIPKEMADGETRVAASPETVGKFKKAGVDVSIETGAGIHAAMSDDAYRAAGAEIVTDLAAGYASADCVLKVREPSAAEAGQLREGSILTSFFLPLEQPDVVQAHCDRKVTSFSMNLVPRISRAQSMDALSSQANIAGYKAVLLAANELPKYFPLMMTAAGTVKPAKVVVMGAGVAGLQAIATARRLGAQVWGTDVRIAVKEQIESLGAKFIDVPGMEDLEDEKGYAKEATPEFLAKQREVVGNQIAESDVVITTALIPGRKAPELIPSDLVQRMKHGAVIVDLAAIQGGNCAETVPGETVQRHGVTVIGHTNLPATVPFHASELYARNITTLMLSMMDEGEFKIDFEDEVVAGSCVTHGGEIKNDAARQAAEGPAS